MFIFVFYLKDDYMHSQNELFVYLFANSLEASLRASIKLRMHVAMHHRLVTFFFKSESCPLEKGGRDYVFSRHRLIR